jgi:SNF2 family DNA or RNA helicase
MNNELKCNGKYLYYHDATCDEIIFANQIFNAYKESQRFVNDLSLLGIRISKISLDVFLTFENKDNGIELKFSSQKAGTKYFLSYVENHLIDYLIINSTCYFFSNLDSYQELLNKISLDDLHVISYTKYIELANELRKANLQFEDNVLKNIEHIKCDDSDLQIYGLKANLFDYQKSGCNWLTFMYKNHCGCILGDEMGLGKTLQVIGLIGYMKEHSKKINTLVIAPISLLENWKREINKFYPSLKILVHHGSKRTGYYKDLIDYDVVITSYSNCQNDLSILNMINWDLVALDEAQNIKNPYSNRAKFIKMINRKMSVAITGTPFENHLTDIWSLTDFVIPQYLGKLNTFKNEYEDSDDAAMKIENYLTPIMIRRKVADVAKDLPERIDIPQALSMTIEEAKYYDSQRKKYITEELKSTRIDKIQGLRMFCTHPSVYKKSDISIEENPIKYSTKYERTCEILEEIFQKEEKAIVFTSFNDMNRIFCRDIPKRFNVETLSITGDTSPNERQLIVDKFSNFDGSALLVLNPRAAGTGLNITAANHVIHYNLEWNPSIEDQASARAYRRGQTKTVFVYRLFYINTIEEIINERISRKREISNLAVVGNQGEIDQNDLIKALKLSPYGGNLND